MKNMVTACAIAIVLFTACNNNSSMETSDKKDVDSSLQHKTGQETSSDNKDVHDSPISGVVNHYLSIKNALAKDDGKEAASAGNVMVEALEKLDQASFTPGQKKTYRDVAADVKENAEHIGKNAEKIDHQREHFDMLSKDMYDMVKAFGAGQTLYQDFCPMYNGKKGATWLSETKEIGNPYVGKKMPTCGSVKEEIKL